MTKETAKAPRKSAGRGTGQKTGKTASATAEHDKIRELAALLEETGLSEIEVETDGTRIRVARQIFASASADIAAIAAASAPSGGAVGPAGGATAAQTGSEAAGSAADDTEADPAAHPGAVAAPMVGTVYLAPEPGAEPFCRPGANVSKGQTLFIIEAMKTMNMVTAPKNGTIKQIYVNNAQPIEFGEVLAIIE